MPFRPFLAASENPNTYPAYFNELRFPKWASPKYDGIRAIVKEGVLMSRKFKPIRSHQCQEEFGMLDHVDGELLVGPVFAHDVYNRCQSHIMAENKPADVSYMLFDYTHPDWLDRPFHERYYELEQLADYWDVYKLAPQEEVNTIDELLECEDRWLTQGAEGLILTDPLAPYKQGRSTWNQQWRVKLKREAQDEGIVVGFVERMTNENEKVTNALGYSERSHHQENKVPCGMVGKFLVEVEGEDEPVSVAPGSFNHEQLVDIWQSKHLYMGSILTFRHFPHGRMKRPRQARAVGFREEDDM